jgi:hypothetical protein
MPTKKMSSVGISGALTTLILAGAHQFFGVTIEPEVAAGLTSIISFGMGWLTRD